MDFLNVNDTMECLHISINIFSVVVNSLDIIYFYSTFSYFMTFLKYLIYGKNAEGGGGG